MVDTRLRNMIRDAQAANDHFLGYQAALYAIASGQLEGVGWKDKQHVVQTPHGGVVVTCNTHYSRWSPQNYPRRLWQNLELSNATSDSSYNHSTFIYNNRALYFRFDVTSDLLCGIPEAHRLHGPYGTTKYPPARRARIAQGIVELVRPFVLSAEGLAWAHACAAGHLANEVLSKLREVQGKETQVEREQIGAGGAGQAYLRYLTFKHRYMSLTPREAEILDLNNPEAAYQEVQHLIVTEQLTETIDYKEIKEERNRVIQTPFGDIALEKTPSGLHARGAWPAQQATGGKPVVFYVELASYGMQGERFSVHGADRHRSRIESRRFANDCMRYGPGPRIAGDNIPIEERRRLAKLIAEQVEAFYVQDTGAEFAIRSQHNVLLVELQSRESQIRSLLQSVAKLQREAGETFLDLARLG